MFNINSITNIKKNTCGTHWAWPDIVTADTNIRVYLVTAAITTNDNYIEPKSDTLFS